MNRKKVYWEKIYAIKGNREIKAIYSRYIDSPDGSIEKYCFYVDGMYINTISPNMITDEIIDSFLNNE